MDPGLKILTFADNKACDTRTLKKEKMHPHDLMDRAVFRIFQQLQTMIPEKSNISILCGPGDNGADGLCLSSMLTARGYSIGTLIFLLGKKPSPALSFRMDLYAQQKDMNVQVVNSVDLFSLRENTWVIDALFGTGLTRPLQNEWESLVNKINDSAYKIISIDMPSGLLGESCDENMPFIKSEKVLTIQSPKPALLYPENKIDFDVVDCGISTKMTNTNRLYLDSGSAISEQMKKLLPKRPRHSHKGTFGHTLLIGGNTGMHGAISMAAKACYEAGSGLTSVLSPDSCITYLAAQPGIMHIPGLLDKSSLPKINAEKFSSVAIGPGLGKNLATTDFLGDLLDMFQIPLILDADALNILSENTGMLARLPENSLITPHPAEFKRLFGPTKNGRDKELLASEKSNELDIYILAKDTYSFLACPDGKIFYNGTGNSGLARGGSGDKLTGTIAGLFAQNQNMRDAALAGMYFSGAGNVVI